MDDTRLKAAHEIGHFFFGHRNGFKMTFVSIVSGKGFSPFNSFEPNQSGLSGDIDVWLGGWAAEAYVRSHARGSSHFKPLRFALSAFKARKHAGWGTASVTSDVSQLQSAGITFRSLPYSTLIKLGKIIHGEQQVFYKLTDSIESNFTMSGKWLSAIMDGVPVTSSMKGDTLEMLVKEYQPKR